jgi:hypothetical protein
MCGSSKSTAVPPPSPPTTFGYGVADGSNTARRAAQVTAATAPTTNPATMTPTDTVAKAGGSTTLGGM